MFWWLPHSDYLRRNGARLSGLESSRDLVQAESLFFIISLVHSAVEVPQSPVESW